MPQRYTTKTGKVMVFPDDATPDEIQAVVDAEEGVGVSKAPGGKFSWPGTAIRTTPNAMVPGAFGDYIKGELASVAEDPSSILAPASAQAGAMTGAKLGLRFGPAGAAVGGVAGAALGGMTGKAGENKIKARPVGQGVAQEGVSQGLMQAVPAVGKAIKGSGTWLYEKALRPAVSDVAKMAESSKMLPSQVRRYLANVGLSHEIPIHNSGMFKAESLKDELEAQIQTLLGDATKAGKQIDMPRVLAQAKAQLQQKFGTQNIPQEDLAAITRRLEQFTENPNLRKPLYSRRPQSKTESFWSDVRGETAPGFEPTGSVFAARQPVDKVNRLRVGSNKHVKGKYGELKASGVEAEKAISRAEADAVKAAVPETAPKFNEWHDLINFQKSLARTSANASNAAPVRLYELLGLISGNPAAVGLGTLSRPAVQGWVGQKLYNVGGQLGSLPPELLRALLLERMNNAPQE